MRGREEAAPRIHTSGSHTPVRSVIDRVNTAIAGWLNPADVHPDQRSAANLHRALLQHLDGKVRLFPAGVSKAANFDRAKNLSVDVLIAEINTRSLAALEQASKALDTASGLGAVYRYESDDWGEPFTEQLSFQELPFVNEIGSLVQWSLGARRIAPGRQFLLRQYINLSLALSYSEIAEQFWVEHQRGSRAQLRRSVRWLAAKQERILAAMDAREIALANSWEQAAFGPFANWPFAAEIRGDADLDELIAHARAYEILGSVLDDRVPLDEEVPKAVAERCDRAWSSLVDAGNVFALVSHWIKAVSRREDQHYCDICYRWRATKKRCREHKTSGAVTPSVRFARNLHGEFGKHLAFLTNRMLRKAYWHTLPHELGACQGPALDGIDVPIRHEDLRRRADVLSRQVRALIRIVGDEIGLELTALFRSVVEGANSELSRSRSSTLADRVNDQRRHRLAIRSVSLEKFLRRWFLGANDSGPRAAPGSPQRSGVDHDNPVAKGRGIDGATLGYDLLRYRAWLEVSEAASARHRIDAPTARQLRSKGLSLAEIARQLGATKEGVRKALARR